MTDSHLAANSRPSLRAENVKAVEALREKIRIKEEEVRQLKIVVNGFYTDEGEVAPYPNANNTEAVASLGSLRSDLFYGKTLAEAAQLYFEMRNASGQGAASVNEIYSALKTGGYAFDTQKEEYAKNGVRISLRKNASIFHQLPGGDYGLRSWYGIKAPKPDSKPKKRKKRRAAAAKASPPPPPQAKETNGQPQPDKAGAPKAPKRKTTVKPMEASV